MPIMPIMRTERRTRHSHHVVTYIFGACGRLKIYQNLLPSFVRQRMLSLCNKSSTSGLTDGPMTTYDDV